MKTTVAPFLLLAAMAAVPSRAQDGRPAAPAKASDTKAADPKSADAKAADIQRLLALTGAVRMGEQMMDQLISIQQKASPEVPAEVWTELRAGLDSGELVGLIAGVWDRHFTHEDIVGLIAFYESPLGTRLIEAQPKILQESMLLGQTWGQQAAQKVFEKLRQKGFPQKST